MWVRAAVWMMAALASCAVGQQALAQSSADTAASGPPRSKANAANNDGSELKPPVAPIASPITDHLAVRASFFDPKVTTNMRVDPTGGAGLGTPFNGEQELGLDPKPLQGLVEVIFRLRDRNRLRVDFYQINRSAEKDLSEQLVLSNNIFPAGTPLQSTFNLSMFGVSYTYSFIRNNRFELGAGVGLHLIQAQVMADEPLTPLRTSETGVGAAPTLVVDGTWRISRRFAATVRGQYFDATISNVKGEFADYHADVQFRAFPNCAVGAGYSVINATLSNDSGSNNLLGQFQLKIAGPEAFVRFSF